VWQRPYKTCFFRNRFLHSHGRLGPTNAHVVKGYSEIAVSAKAGEFSSATVLATDTANDLALLKTNERPENVAALRQMPRLGESVEAFGYPLADILATSGNFSLGNIQPFLVSATIAVISKSPCPFSLETPEDHCWISTAI
jgi:hypothetical protein